MASVEIFNPVGLAAPRGTYSHVARAPAGATLVAIAGQVAIDPDGLLVGPDDVGKQADQVYANIAAALTAIGGGWDAVISTMTFLTRREDLVPFRAWREREYPRLFAGGRYPANTLLVVDGLAHEDFLLEVQVTAAV
jgi:enamine deaminase RidA (YjgF/YER057c/UK114 family)